MPRLLQIAYFRQLLAKRVLLIVEVIDVEVGNGPVVHFAKQRNTSRRKHGTHELHKFVVVQVVTGVDALKDLDGGLRAC